MQFINAIYILASILALAQAAPAEAVIAPETPGPAHIAERDAVNEIVALLAKRGFTEESEYLAKRADAIQHAPEGFTPQVGQATAQLTSEAGKTSAGNIYGVLDSLDHVADYATAALGDGLSPVTGGMSKQVSDFLGGKLVQSINHGTFALASYGLGDAMDGATGLSQTNAMSDRVNTASNSLKSQNLNTDQIDQNNINIRKQLVAADPNVTFSAPIVASNGTVLYNKNVASGASDSTTVSPSEVSAASSRLAAAASASPSASPAAAGTVTSTTSSSSGSSGILGELVNSVSNIFKGSRRDIQVDQGELLVNNLLANLDAYQAQR